RSHADLRRTAELRLLMLLLLFEASARVARNVQLGALRLGGIAAPRLRRRCFALAIRTRLLLLLALRFLTRALFRQTAVLRIGRLTCLFRRHAPRFVLNALALEPLRFDARGFLLRLLLLGELRLVNLFLFGALDRFLSLAPLVDLLLLRASLRF